MQERPGRRRFRSRRPRSSAPRPTQGTPQPERPRQVPQRGPRLEQPRGPRGDRRPARGRPRPPRQRDNEIRPGTPVVILLDCREGDPDRTGTTAVFEGFFDLESGEPRRPGNGVPRLRIGDDRVWGFECWWRADPEKAGFTAADREDLEASKRLLRGLLRAARRAGQRAFAR